MALKNLFREKLAKVLSGGGEETVEISTLNIAEIGKGMAVALLSGILGMSGGIFTCHPFGIAILCASEKYTVYSYLGLLVSALASRGMALALAITYTITLLFRYGVSKFLLATGEKISLKEQFRNAFSTKDEPPKTGKLFSERLMLRIAVAAASAFIFGLYRLVGGGFLYHDLFGLLSGFFLTPIITAALSGAFVKSAGFEYSREVAVATLTFITVYSLNDYRLFGFSPALMAAFFLTFWASGTVGGLKGCAVGLLAGLATTSTAFVSGSEAALAGLAPCLMAFTGLSMGILRRFIGNFAVIFSALVVSALGWALGGFEVLKLFMPDMMSAAVIFLPLSKYKVLPKITVFISPRTEKLSDENLLLAKKDADSRQRLVALSDAFSHLSDTIYALSDRMRRPGVVDLKRACDNAFSEYCGGCSLASVCLEKEYLSTLDAQSKITAVLYKNGRAELSDIPAHLKNRCYNISSILEEMNRTAAKLIEGLIKTDRTEAFAIDYEIMSKLLAARINEADEEYKPDAELTKKLCKSLEYMNIASRRAICFGKRRKQVIIGDFDISSVHMGARELREAVENTLGIPMSAPSFTLDGEDSVMCLTSRRKYKITSAVSAAMKASEAVNGDNTSIFTGREDYGYAIISDGMGSGKDAAITSKICTLFAERMLSAGNGVAITMEMLSSFIRSRGVECSATVDLCEVDLITGEASFIKSGAAPSFVLRRGNIYKLQSKTMPIGILPELDAEKIKFTLEAGDVIVMLSDGIATGLEDGVWLANLLTYEWEDELQKMADKILDAASTLTRKRDDMTVMLLRIEENPE